MPFSARAHESDKLVWGSDGEGGCHSSNDDIVLEVVKRGGGENRKKGVERVLEGWINGKGPCELERLPALKNVFGKVQRVEEVNLDCLSSITTLTFVSYRLHQTQLRIYRLISI